MELVYIIISLILCFNIYILIQFYHFPTEEFNCYVKNNEYTTNIECLNSCDFEMVQCVNRTLFFQIKTTYPKIVYSVIDEIILIVN